jgi:hypothetical protein
MEATSKKSTSKKTQSPPHSPPKLETRVSPRRKRIKGITQKIHNKLLGWILNTLCFESGYCISFGLQSVRIREFFENFDMKYYLKGVAKPIGEESANGFVKELTYTRENYSANTVLKSSRKINGDNLFYEGVVGQYINKMALIYPCFLQTYGIYEYDDNLPDTPFRVKDMVGVLMLDKDGKERWSVGRIKLGPKENGMYDVDTYNGQLYDVLVDNMRRINKGDRVYKLLETSSANNTKRDVSVSEFADKFRELPVDVDNLIKSCINSQKICINIEHIKGCTSIKDFLEQPVTYEQFLHYFCNELLYILYQVYMPLAMMANNFTHYDLHDGNVQLYKLGSDQYVQYHYHLSDDSVTSFKSEYLVKIIDYGRSFFDDDSNTGLFVNSERIFTKLCEQCM